MKRKDFLLFTLLLTQTMPVWAMDTDSEEDSCSDQRQQNYQDNSYYYTDEDIETSINALIHSHERIEKYSGKTFLLKQKNKADALFPSSNGEAPYYVALLPACICESEATGHVRQASFITYFLNGSSRPDTIQTILQELLSQENFEAMKKCLESKDQSVRQGYLQIINENRNDIKQIKKAFRLQLEKREETLTKEKYNLDVFDEILESIASLEQASFKIVFPFCQNDSHWYVGEIQGRKLNDQQYNFDIFAHNPYGAQNDSSNFSKLFPKDFHNIEVCLKNKLGGNATLESKVRLSDRPRQSDGISCGPIMVDDLFKRILNQDLNISVPHPHGALSIRQRHIDVVKTIFDNKIITSEMKTKFVKKNDRWLRQLKTSSSSASSSSSSSSFTTTASTFFTANSSSSAYMQEPGGDKDMKTSNDARVSHPQVSVISKIKESPAKIFDQDEFTLSDFYLSYNPSKKIWLLSSEESMKNPTIIQLTPPPETLLSNCLKPLKVTPSQYKLVHFFDQIDDKAALSKILKRKTWSTWEISQFTYQLGDKSQEFNISPYCIGMLPHVWKKPIITEVLNDHYTTALIKPEIMIDNHSYEISEGKILKTHDHELLATLEESNNPNYREYSSGFTYLGQSWIKRIWQRKPPSDDKAGWSGMPPGGTYDDSITRSNPDNQNVVHTWVRAEDGDNDDNSEKNLFGEYRKIGCNPLASPYLYSDGKDIYLTKCDEEKWGKNKQNFLARLISPIPYRIILNKNSLFSPHFLLQGVYIKTNQMVGYGQRIEYWQKIQDHSDERENILYKIVFPHSSSSWVKEISPPFFQNEKFSQDDLGKLEALPILKLGSKNIQGKAKFSEFRHGVLVHLKNLSELSLTYVKGLGNLEWANDNLVSLSLMLCDLDEAAHKNIARLTNLTSLNLTGSSYALESLISSCRSLLQLTCLNLSGLSIGVDAYKIGKIFTQLVSLVLQNTNIKDSKTINIGALGFNVNEETKNSNLRTLKLASNELTDTEVDGIRLTYPNLTSLDLSNNRITSSGTTVLQKRTDLTKLDLSHNKIDSIGVNAILTHLNQLRFLKLNNNNIDFESLLRLVSKFPWLTLSMIDDNHQLRNGFLKLTQQKDLWRCEAIAPRLRGLSIDDSSADECCKENFVSEGVIAHMPHLESLHISNQTIPFALNHIKSLIDIMANLTELKLNYTKIDDDATQYLFKNGTNLTNLALENVGINRISSPIILPKLTSLNLNGNNAEIQLSYFVELTNLQNLYIKNNNLNFGTHIPQFAKKLSNLLELNMNAVGSKLDNASLQVFSSHLTKLKKFKIAGHSINKVDLRQLTHLTYLDLSDNPFNDDNKVFSENLNTLLLNKNKAHFKYLRGLTNLTRLDFSRGNKKLDNFSTVISQLTNLTSLNLYRDTTNADNLGNDNLILISQHCPNLTFLDVSGNGIGDASINILAPRLTKLTEFHLHYNNVSDTGAQNIAQRLTNLGSLNLSYTNVRIDGATALSRLTRLYWLDLSDNNLGGQQARLNTLFPRINNKNIKL